MKMRFFALAPLLIGSLFADSGYYKHPGDVTFSGGKWEGADQLANLSTAIPIDVSVIVPSGKEVAVDSAALVDAIAKVWSEHKIENSTPPQGTHQFFSVQVLVYPMDGGIAATIQGRLFEGVEVKRVVNAKEHYLQAVTWEQDSLIVATNETFNPLLVKTVEGVAKNFAERFDAFRKAEASSQKGASQS